ncbi:ArsR/SmtB family transcription factor [Angustibacter aerolatus]
MDVFEAVSDPGRRMVLELLAAGERPAGDAVALLGERLGLSQPAVSRHLRVLRETGLVTTRTDGARRVYALVPGALDGVRGWLDAVTQPDHGAWEQRLDALETEVARRRRSSGARTGAGGGAGGRAGGGDRAGRARADRAVGGA